MPNYAVQELKSRPAGSASLDPQDGLLGQPQRDSQDIDARLAGIGGDIIRP
jgi:hypothetical protein